MKKRTIPGSEIKVAIISFKGAFIALMAFSVVSNLVMLVPSIYMLQVYDRVLPSRNETTLIMLTIMALGAYILLAFLDLVRSVVLIRIGAKFDFGLNERVFTASFEKNLKCSGYAAGVAIQDLTTLRQTFSSNTVLAVFDAPWFPIYLVTIFAFQPTLGVLALLGTTLLVLLAVVSERLTSHCLSEANSLAVAAGNIATNNLRNSEVIEAMGMLPKMMSRWRETYALCLRLQARSSETVAWISGATKFVQISLQSLVLGLGAMLVLEQQITGGMMIAASILVGRALAPVQQFIGGWRAFVGARSAYQRLCALLKENPPRPDRMSLPKPVGQLSVHSINVTPPGANSIVLKNVSFRTPNKTL